ncbi:MAG: hypothetical protein ACOWWH_00315 [Eubacteriaceae bacterium]
MKKLIISLIIVMSIILFGCKNEIELNDNESIDMKNSQDLQVEATETDFENYTNFSLAVKYDTIGDMSKDADCIIMGKVKELEYVDVDVACVYTKTIFEIEKCYKGNYQKGDLVTYSKYGGITTLDNYWDDVKHHLDPKDNMTKEKAKNYTVASYIGTKDTMLQVDDKLLIFGKFHEEDLHKDIPKGSIYSLSVYQTEFYIDEAGNIERYVEDNEGGNMKQTLAEFEEKTNEAIRISK